MSRALKPSSCAFVRSTRRCRYGSSKGCWNAQVGGSRDIAEFLKQLAGPNTVAFDIVSDHLDVNGCRQSKVQDLCHHVGREEGEHYPWEFLCQLQPQISYVIFRRVMRRCQRDQDVSH